MSGRIIFSDKLGDERSFYYQYCNFIMIQDHRLHINNYSGSAINIMISPFKGLIGIALSALVTTSILSLFLPVYGLEDTSNCDQSLPNHPISHRILQKIPTLLMFIMSAWKSLLKKHGQCLFHFLRTG